MEKKTVLNVLSPQLQALVEASLGTTLPTGDTRKKEDGVRATAGAGDAVEATNETAQDPPARTQTDAVQANTTSHIGMDAPLQASIVSTVKLNPSELFVLKHPDSPGFIVKDRFLGHSDAARVRNALVQFAKSAEFHQAGVGYGDNKRHEQAARGDRIHWIQRPRDLTRPDATLDAAIVHLLRQVERLVVGVKSAIPELDLRNVTSTQLAIFPGDGSRFVKHTDTYSSNHPSAKGSDNLVRLITCVYYLNPDWIPAHGGSLRFFVDDKQQWDVPPVLDTLAVFRSRDVEHEVLPTFHERMALTIWYYGPASAANAPKIPQLHPAISSFLAPPAPPQVKPQASTTPSSTQEMIFVAIPSYRDPECPHTVADLLAKATHPDRITIGICLQDEDDTMLEHLKETYPPTTVRIEWIHYSHAAGPCVARAMAQSLWKNEQYYLQIDSHMRFRHGWDVELLAQLKQCPSEKAILTTYPLGYTLPNEISSDTRPALLCASGFDDQGMLRQASKTLTRVADKPIPSLFWAAGFAFSSADVIKEVLYDQSLRFLFFGEEASMSARLWTHGWDFFAPSEMFIYHLWTRAYRPVFQELESEDTKKSRLESLKSVKAMLSGEWSNPVFGLGSARSLSDYQRHIGVDFVANSVEWRAEWGNLDPIQFDLSSKMRTAQ
ncbi:hypothetical protein Poli38472_006469 [Pythium oligandrum]|uniref:procollagen-lysine 5-dioxygenase n=1 Tax=Pythium oligandrum TaxID=41045 RepID=A0A8K1FD38_PYTOL|nr:hypothetical protein Poli38472_006469 [Pythium oligandrum]|eukprot:TMW56459.1 hypothetical protein Poli38472_006469 [Pythium oligandrum]